MKGRTLEAFLSYQQLLLDGFKKLFDFSGASNVQTSRIPVVGAFEMPGGSQCLHFAINADSEHCSDVFHAVCDLISCDTNPCMMKLVDFAKCVQSPKCRKSPIPLSSSATNMANELVSFAQEFEDKLTGQTKFDCPCPFFLVIEVQGKEERRLHVMGEGFSISRPWIQIVRTVLSSLDMSLSEELELSTFALPLIALNAFDKQVITYPCQEEEEEEDDDDEERIFPVVCMDPNKDTSLALWKDVIETM